MNTKQENRPSESGGTSLEWIIEEIGLFGSIRWQSKVVDGRLVTEFEYRVPWYSGRGETILEAVSKVNNQLKDSNEWLEYRKSLYK